MRGPAFGRSFASNIPTSRRYANQSAVFVLDRKNLTLDGIDLVVDVRDLSPKQTALFSCSGSNLTLRNCSITILNDTNASFSVFRVEASASRPTRDPAGTDAGARAVRGGC